MSISTVSRVLNGLDRVHPDTVRRIQAAMQELHYQPSAFARGLALQRTHTIGFITPMVTEPFFAEMARGVEDAVAAAGYSLLIASQPAQSDERRFHQLFVQGRVDGLVLVAINVRQHELDHLMAQGFPVAVIQEDLGGTVPTFVADNYGGARALAEHLVGHGYRRIGYIAGSDYTPDSRERLRGLQDVLEAHERSLPDSYIAQGDYKPGSGYSAMCRLLELSEPPEAVFAANDQMAADAIKAARAKGLTPPNDIAIVGFDDIALANYMHPALTTVRQPTYEMGRLAVEAIMTPSRNGHMQARVTLPTTLVVRESCGCAP